MPVRPQHPPHLTRAGEHRAAEIVSHEQALGLVTTPRCEHAVPGFLIFYGKAKYECFICFALKITLLVTTNSNFKHLAKANTFMDSVLGDL